MSNKESNLKYQQIINASQALFWKHGIKRVSVEEICSLAKVSKMTFYRFFPNKIELAKHLLQELSEESLKTYRNLINSDLSFIEKVNKMIEMKLKSTNNIGQEFISDLYKNNELGLLPCIEKAQKESLDLTISFIADAQKKNNELGLLPCIEKAQKESLDLTISFIADAQKKGFIRQNLTIDFILYFFNQMAKIITDNELVVKYKTPQALIFDQDIPEYLFTKAALKQ